ncbi:hypothetical protein HU200_031265 [Digitaria exilis]|uniref:Uncharacterized protein n=1 Tax=Digitaria exilis TaxID=1010633 RepID=A0A835BQV7_9POAL|nr:hypothetical protein HU200_031265 [Digitaria exilis]
MASCSTLRRILESARGAASKLHQAAFEAVQCGLLGLVTVSTAVSLAARSGPPARLHTSTYYFIFYLLLSVAFFAGMAEITGAVIVSTTEPRRRRANYASWRKLTCCACVSASLLAVIVSLSVG